MIEVGEELNRECVRYLNRLSDLLFILSRGANAGDGAAVGTGPVPLSESALYPAEHRALRELHATARQLASHWGRLADRLGGAPASRCATAPCGRAASAASWPRRPAKRGLHGFPAAQGVGSQLAGLRNSAGDLVLERNQALRLAVLDAEHVTTLLLYLAALAERRDDVALAAFHRRWAGEIAAPATPCATPRSRSPAIPTTRSAPPSPPRSAAPATAPPPRSARWARRSTARRSAAPRASSPAAESTPGAPARVGCFAR